MGLKYIGWDITYRFTGKMYFYYKRFCRTILKLKPTDIVSKPEYNKIQGVLWKTIKEHYLNNEGGVCINNLGYFCHLAEIKQQTYAKRVISKYIFTNGYKYVSLLWRFPFTKKFQTYYFVMDSIVPGFRRERNSRLEYGVRYRFLKREIDFERQVNPEPKYKLCLSRLEKR